MTENLQPSLFLFVLLLMFSGMQESPDIQIRHHMTPSLWPTYRYSVHMV